MIRTKAKKTVADYMSLPQEHGAELIEGELVMSPSPTSRHQRVLRNLSSELTAFLKRTGWGELLFAPMDVILSDDTVVQPDLFVVRRERLAIVKERVEGVPDLVVEILSAYAQDRDLLLKRDLYAKHGVKEYWIVDPEARTVEALAWRDGRFELIAIFESKDVLVTPLLPDLSLDLATIWA